MSDAGAPTPLRVMIVEDDFLVSMLIEEAVTAAGMELVGVAGSAAEALALARESRPDIATMDISLRGSDEGVGLAVRLREECGIACLFASAFSDGERMSAAAPAKPLGWVAKPFSLNQMTVALLDAKERLRPSS